MTAMPAASGQVSPAWDILGPGLLAMSGDPRACGSEPLWWVSPSSLFYLSP